MPKKRKAVPDTKVRRLKLTEAEKRINKARKTKDQYLDLSGVYSVGTAIRNLPELRILDLSFCGLSTIPESIGDLKLESISLSGNMLIELPDWLGELKSLTSLDVSSNQLTTLPASITKLTKLRHLYISENRLESLPELLVQFPALVGLHISQNGVATLPDWIGSLRTLLYLSAASNQLTHLPDSLCRLENLQLLSLSDNPLTEIPELISELTALQGINLSIGGSVLVWEPQRSTWTTSGLQKKGKLRSLPQGLRRLSSLRELYLHGQQLLGLPPEVVGSKFDDTRRDKAKSPANPATILDYYFRTHGKGASSRPLNEAKMILVGRGGVGKTSLVNRLVHNRYNPNETKTEGIFITPWQVQIHEDQIKLNIWDFGGQEIMHSTHQFFLTKRSLYLLVLNAREGEQDANVEYWLRLIESFGGGSPIIVVINKVSDHIFDLNRRGLKEKFPAIKEFIQTDCEAELGLADLRAAILRETDRLEHLRDLFPASWFTVMEKLANLRQYEGHDFISFSRYQALCDDHGIQEAVGQETLVGFLHDLGIVINFRDDPRLAEMHVLNPEWVTNGIYKILNAETLARKQGELHLADLPSVLSPKLYPRQMHLFLLDLMRKFELCYEYYETMGHYLVPELLGKEEPNLTALTPADALLFEYRYNIVPEGLLPRFIVRSRVLNKNQPRWRTGVVLSWEGNTAIVKADPQDRKVSIAISGPPDGRRRLLVVIRADFEHIHSSIAKLQAKEVVPVPGRSGLAVDYEALLVMEAEGESEMKLVHDGKVVKVDVPELLGGLEEGRRGRKALTSPVVPKSLRIAFSYSHKDEELRDQLETHLKLLQRQGYVSSWHDRKITEGDKWKDVIDENFNRAELILLLVSSDFIASDYCYEIEMKTALERESKGEARVVPIILRACDWKEAPFHDLQGLPTDARPVTSWSNRDEAWNDVARGIRRAVERVRQSYS